MRSPTEALRLPVKPMYRTAEYRCEGKRGHFSASRETYIYRWVDPTFRLEDRIAKLEAQAREDYRTINRLRIATYGVEYKNGDFDDGMGGW